MIEISKDLASHERVMVIAPHPDDESIATGGVLLRAASARAPVRVLYLTDGENNPWAQRATEGRWSIAADDRRRWGARRRREALEALNCLGIPSEFVRFLGFPDQRLTDLLATAAGEAVVRLAEELRAWRPTALFVPSLLDRHPDHSAAAVMTQLALAELEREAHPGVLTYTVHGPARLDGRIVRLQALSRSEHEAKERAILCHASQLRLRRHFLTSFARGPEQFEPGFPTGAENDAAHPLRLVGAGREKWSFTLRRSLLLTVRRPTLLLIAQGNGERHTLSLPIPRRVGRSRIVQPGGGNILGEVSTQVRGGRLVLTIVSPHLRNADFRLAKLELGWDRKLGIFDSWPWLSFGLPAGSPSRSPIESAGRLPSYAQL